MMALLEADGISTAGQRGYHLLWTLAQQTPCCASDRCGASSRRSSCSTSGSPGPIEISRSRRRSRWGDSRHATSQARGPATIADFAWWAGITKTEARAGVEQAGAALQRVATSEAEFWMPAEVAHVVRVIEADHAEKDVHLLPGFDEYFLGYTDRTRQLGEHVATYGATVSANGMFSPTLIIDGRVAGTWKRTLRRNQVDVAVRPFRTIGAAEKRGLIEAADEYGRFVQREAVLET